MEMKKWIATILATVMASATFAGSVLAAVQLGNYPSFLAVDGALDAFVVVGAAAKPEDVVGAVDVAIRLAELSYKEKTVTGAGVSAVDGIERKLDISNSVDESAVAGGQFPSALKNFHYSGLKQGTFDYKGTKYSYHEQVNLGVSNPAMAHKITDPVNGTIKLKIDSEALEYRYYFDQTIPSSQFNTSTTAYDYPLIVMLAGKEFDIVKVRSAGSFDAITGSIGWVTAGSTTGVTVGDYTALVEAVYTGTQAAVKIVDATGNVVGATKIVGTTGDSWVIGGDTYRVKVLATATTGKESVADSAKLAFSKGDLEKTYDGSADTATFPGAPDWKVGGSFANDDVITAGDYIYVKYSPATLEEKNKYYAAGDVFKGPEDYFEIAFTGLSVANFAKVTISPVTGKTVYNTTASTGYSSWSGLNGLEISSDVAGTIGYGANNYDKIYILFNVTLTTGQFNGTGSIYGYWDKSYSKIVNITPWSYANSSMESFKLSYGGGGLADFYLNITRVPSTGDPLDVVVWSSGGTQVTMDYTNKSAATAGSGLELRLGSNSATADDNDVIVRIGGTTSQPVGTQLKDVISNAGIWVYTPKDNAASEKVVFGIPAETVQLKIGFGKIGAVTEGGVVTYKEIVPIKTAVAKLDTEVTDADKAKNLVLVGGPAVNRLTAAALGVPYPSYGAASGIPENAALIKAVDGAFTSGKVALVVAGWEAKDTRLATSVLQNYETKLAGITASSVKVAGESVAVATITPL